MSAEDPTDDEVAQQRLLRHECVRYHNQACHACWDRVCCDCTCEDRPAYAKDCGQLHIAKEADPEKRVQSLFEKVAKCANCRLRTCRDWREIEVMEGAE